MNEKTSLDQERVAYMIAWRDKHIADQDALLRGYLEERQLLDALLFYALFSSSQGAKGEVRETVIPKEGLRELLDGWRCVVENGKDAYHLRFYSLESIEQEILPSPDEVEDGEACHEA